MPLYAAPDDLLTIDLDRALSRARRTSGCAGASRASASFRTGRAPTSSSGKAPVASKALVYVDDPVEAFFLQIQGSGRVRLADGGVMRVGYADQNGHPFRSIGRVLIERGELTLDARVDAGRSRTWGAAQSREAAARCSTRIRATCSSAKCRRRRRARSKRRSTDRSASLGVPLLRERTLAVDTRSIPLGAPVFLATTYPLSTQPLQRLMLAQDTGGAIRGAVRARFLLGLRRRRRTAGGPDEAGRADVDPVAEGRGPPRAARAA